MSFYSRNLPHWQPDQAEFFITFRLAGSLPRVAIEKLKQYQAHLKKDLTPQTKNLIQKRIFKKYEHLLTTGEVGPTWLKDDRVASIVAKSLHFYDGSKYELYAFCIMPNHVHLIFRLLKQLNESENSKHRYKVTDILHSIKSYTGLKCNKILGRTGAFWQPESYDRVIRDQKELENTIRYTLNNPVKAGFVDRWEDWDHSYCKTDFKKSFS